MTLYLHEVHRVRGAREDEFEALFRDGWMPALAGSDDARLLWFCRLAHGSGPSYRVVTVTAVADGAAWERLAERVRSGDLHAWARDADACRHDVVGKLLLAVPWSPTADVDLASVPADPAADQEPALFMEDTGWPHAPVDDYVAFWERVYVPLLARSNLLSIEAAFQVAHGAGRRPEAILWQKVVDHQALLALLAADTPAERKAPGTFMHDALAVRDQWESRLLRTARWSPWH